MRILLVEDQSDAAQILAKGLREQSYAVDIAPDGEAALYQASINDYDLILPDVMLRSAKRNRSLPEPASGWFVSALEKEAENPI